MWLILADETDTSALWLYNHLKRAGLNELQIVSSGAVAYNLYWNYRMTNDRSDSEFVFGDGRRLKTAGISGVFNRLTSLPAEHVRSPFLSGRRHTQREQMAYFVSWMYGLPVPVINRPSIYSLSGAWHEASEWSMLASMTGLHLAPFCQSGVTSAEPEITCGRLTPFDMPVQTVYVVGSRVVGSHVPAHIADACVRLGGMAKADLLGIQFVVNSPWSWLVAGVSAYPELETGGEPLAEAIFQHMARQSYAALAAC